MPGALIAVAPARVSAKHQSLLHLVGQAAWSDEAVLAKVRELVLPAIEAQGKIEAWIVDDTGFAKKGVHSVGVARQYCGRLGKTDNCQIAVTLSIANHAASLPIAYRLYLPEDWAGDEARRKKVRVPDEVKFRTKPEIALAQIRTALAAGVAPGVLLTDAGYGADGAFRSGVTASGLAYVVGVQSTLSVWPPGAEPLPPKPWSGRGRPPSRMRRDGEHALFPPRRWRGASRGGLAHRSMAGGLQRNLVLALRRRADSAGFARLEGSTPHPLEWLLIEWPEGEKEPTKYWLSTLPEDTPIDVLVDTAKLRWRIERDYEELKSELGLAHFEGRSWRGFHHHATLCIAAYGFLIRERAAIPPSGPRRRETSRISTASQTPRRRRSDPNGISKTRSRQSEDNSRSRWPEPSCAARVAKPSQLDHLCKTTLSRIVVTQ